MQSCQSRQFSDRALVKIKKLDEAANFLMLVSDRKVGLLKTCHLSSEDALRLLQPLHAMIDEEVKNISHLITSELIDSCAVNCHCGVYADASQSEVLKNKFYLKAKTLSKEGQLDCANKTSIWICEDLLLTELKAQQF